MRSLSLLERNKNSWLFVVFGIVALILWNTNLLFDRLKTEERKKMELWAMAQKESIQNQAPTNLTLEVLLQTGTNPMIQVDTRGRIIGFKNIVWEVSQDSALLYRQLRRFKTQNDPIPIYFKIPEQSTPLVDQKLYYGDSSMLLKLQYYPLALLLIIFLFGLVLYYVFKTIRISEQNKLWAGMAKETAHQIGTPLSSMLGWIALGKEDSLPKDTDAFTEMEKDVHRLQLITDRFSKICSLPQLVPLDWTASIRTTLQYLENRSAEQIHFSVSYPETVVEIEGNSELLSWTLENLVKNGIDAMKGKGTLRLWMEIDAKKAKLYVQDEGQGILKEHRKKIFSPGFSTKKRGWGLGLSLAKRIVEHYHKGQLGIVKTAVGVGTTFCISLERSR